jgi:hypothetical protein
LDWREPGNGFGCETFSLRLTGARPDVGTHGCSDQQPMRDLLSGLSAGLERGREEVSGHHHKPGARGHAHDRAQAVAVVNE